MKEGFTIKEINGLKHVEYLGREIDKYWLLSQVIDAPTIEDGLYYLKLSNVYRYDEVFNTLYFPVSFCFARKRYYMFKNQPNEAYYQNLFKEIYPLMSGASIVEIKHDKENIPDAWVNYNGENIPVEIKKDKFNKKALSQLQRYIKAYNAKKGIAVGMELTIELPENIQFVPISSLIEYKNKSLDESKE